MSSGVIGHGCVAFGEGAVVVKIAYTQVYHRYEDARKLHGEGTTKKQRKRFDTLSEAYRILTLRCPFVAPLLRTVCWCTYCFAQGIL